MDVTQLCIDLEASADLRDDIGSVIGDGELLEDCVVDKGAATFTHRATNVEDRLVRVTSDGRVAVSLVVRRVAMSDSLETAVGDGAKSDALNAALTREAESKSITVEEIKQRLLVHALAELGIEIS